MSPYSTSADRPPSQNPWWQNNCRSGSWRRDCDPHPLGALSTNPSLHPHPPGLECLGMKTHSALAAGQTSLVYSKTKVNLFDGFKWLYVSLYDRSSVPVVHTCRNVYVKALLLYGNHCRFHLCRLDVTLSEDLGAQLLMIICYFVPRGVNAYLCTRVTHRLANLFIREIATVMRNIVYPTFSL